METTGQLSIFDFIEQPAKVEHNVDWWQEHVLGYPCSDCINYISKKVEYGTGCKYGIDARLCFCDKHTSKLLTKER